MVCGALNATGVGPLILLDGTLNAEKYIQIIEALLQKVPRLRSRATQRLVFQQDNAAPHTAAAVTDYFAAKRVKIIPWPANSPDLNIIEHCWETMSLRMRGKNFPTKTALWAELQAQWAQISSTQVRMLYVSMQRRLEAPTRY